MLETVRQRWVQALVLALLFLATGCDLEDRLTINADGSGTYRRRLSITNIELAIVAFAAGSELQQYLGQVKKSQGKSVDLEPLRRLLPVVVEPLQAAQIERFQLVDVLAEEGGLSVIVNRNFGNVKDLNSGAEIFEFERRPGAVRSRAWTFHAFLKPISLRRRQLIITLPETINASSMGMIEGHSVSWECTDGGKLNADCGLVIWTSAIVALALLGAVLIVYLTMRVKRSLRPI